MVPQKITLAKDRGKELVEALNMRCVKSAIRIHEKIKCT